MKLVKRDLNTGREYDATFNVSKHFANSGHWYARRITITVKPAEKDEENKDSKEEEKEQNDFTCEFKKGDVSSLFAY